MENNPTEPKPARGAQKGNRNALKHGFYSRQFNPRDLAALSKIRPSSLDSEIALMRTFIRRLTESSQDIVDYPGLYDLLRLLCLASSSLPRLVRARHLIEGNVDEDTAAFDEAVQELFGHRAIFREDREAEAHLHDRPNPAPPIRSETNPEPS
jgi:hypothetical protein